MYVNVCMYVCVYVYMYVCVCMRVYVYVCLYVYMYVYVCALKCVHVCFQALHTWRDLGNKAQGLVNQIDVHGVCVCVCV